MNGTILSDNLKPKQLMLPIFLNHDERIEWQHRL